MFLQPPSPGPDEYLEPDDWTSAPEVPPKNFVWAVSFSCSSSFLNITSILYGVSNFPVVLVTEQLAQVMAFLAETLGLDLYLVSETMEIRASLKKKKLSGCDYATG